MRYILFISLFAFSLFSETQERVKIKKSTELIIDDSDGESLGEEKTRVLAEKRRSLIEDIKRYLRESKSETQKMELSLRLGSLYMEDYRALNAKSHSAEGAERNLNVSTSKASLTKALTIYRGLIKKYPNHPKSDEMLYSLALASQDGGNHDSAMHYFQELAKTKSRYQSDALLQLADHYFDSNQFEKAMEYYNRILQLKNRRLLPYAIYKKAWCLYNAGDHTNAIKHFRSVARLDSIDAFVRVKNEAIRDIALPFAESRSVSEALSFYGGLDTHLKRQGLEVMAGLLLEKGAYPESIQLYSHLLEIDSNWKNNPSYEIGIIECLRKSSRSQEAVERLFARMPLYLSESTWYDINSSDPKNIAEFKAGFEETARKYALEYHAEGQKTKNTTLYDAAKALYGKYLEFFSNTAHAPKIRFYLAEILYKENRWVESADEYVKVYRMNAAGALKIDAIRYALGALSQLVNEERKKKGLSRLNSKSKIVLRAQEPYSPVEQRFLDLGNEYTSAYSSEKDVPDVLYEQSYLSYSHHFLDDAYKGFWSLIQRFPKHATAKSSGFLVLDILNSQNDYPKLITVSKMLIRNRELATPAFTKEVRVVLRAAELKLIALREAKGEYKAAADAYLEFTKSYAQEDPILYEKALYNAGVNYALAGLIPQSLDTQEHFLRRFPESPLRAKSLIAVARGFESLALLDKSALYFEQFVSEFPEHPQAQNALRLSGLYYWGSAHHRKAESILNDYRAKYPDDRAVVSDLIDILESQGLKNRQIQFYLSERAKKGISASDYLALSLKILDLSDHSKSLLQKEISKAATLFRKELVKSPKGIDSLSRVLFREVAQVDQKFHNLRLERKNLEGRLKAKLELLQSLDKKYGEVTGLGSPEWGLGSIYRTAFAYSQMALEVSQAPVPSELSQEELEIYRSELARELVTPFREKALVMAKNCLDKSTELNILSEWVTQCNGLRASLDPENIRLSRTFYLPPLSVSVQGTSTPRTPAGDYKLFSYPYYSTALFQVPAAERSHASGAPWEALERDIYQPRILDYRSLASERKGVLQSLLTRGRPMEGEIVSFAYLNLLRLVHPLKATPSIMRAIAQDPSNTSLLNLLALNHLDQGNLTTAKVLWLSLIARGERTGQTLNNLGVVAWLEHKPRLSDEYWNEAILGGSKEASLNKGFVALKYQNGFEAKKYFEMNDIDSSAPAMVGMAVAQLQNREFESARDLMISATRKYKSDPYARLTIGYYLMDIEKRPEAAERLLSDYAFDTTEIQAALTETKRSLSSSQSAAGLPMIGQ